MGKFGTEEDQQTRKKEMQTGIERFSRKISCSPSFIDKHELKLITITFNLIFYIY